MNQEPINYRIPLRKLRKMRRDMRITQAMIAERLHITTQFYSQIERGVNTLSYSNAVKIAAYLGTTPDELFQDEFMRFHTFIWKNREYK